MIVMYQVCCYVKYCMLLDLLGSNYLLFIENFSNRDLTSRTHLISVASAKKNRKKILDFRKAKAHKYNRLKCWAWPMYLSRIDNEKT